MERLTLKITAISLFAFCIAQVGCQSPGTPMDSLSFGGQTRVPPPPTGAVGPGSGYKLPASAPPNYLSPQPSGMGSFQPNNSASPSATSTQFTDTSGNSNNLRSAESSTQLTRAENAAWSAPIDSAYQYAGSASQAQPMPPGAFNVPGSVAPLATDSPRIRGFSSYNQQPVQVPPELAGYQNGPIQQASANGSNWQSR